MLRVAIFGMILGVFAAPVLAQEAVPLAPVTLTDWKPVYGRIEARDNLPARARIGAAPWPS